MNPPAVPPPASQKRDLDHLRILAVCHFVFAVVSIAAIGILFFHHQMMELVFSSPEFSQQQSGAPFDPAELFGLFIWAYIAGGVLLVLLGLLNILAGWGLLKHRFRTLSFVVAGIDCLSIPLGTTLGIFSIIVLSRPSVAQLYADANTAGDEI